MSTGRFLLRSVALGTALGGFAADWNRTHLFNPAWPPHARFHDAQTIALGALLGGAALQCLRTDDDARRVALGAGLPALFWTSMAASFVFPGTAGMQSEFPELVPQVRGVWIDERFAAGLMLMVGLGGYLLERRRLRRGGPERARPSTPDLGG
jgi:hypothetical protein